VLKAAAERAGQARGAYAAQAALAAARSGVRHSGERVPLITSWLTLIGPGATCHEIHVPDNYLTGLILHQLAIRDRIGASGRCRPSPSVRRPSTT
jgi:hypothetical protein